MSSSDGDGKDDARLESYDKWVIKTGVKNIVIDQMAAVARYFGWEVTRS